MHRAEQTAPGAPLARAAANMKRAIYPGHPVTLAHIITQVFDSWEAATANTSQTPYCDARTSQDVPGAGGNVVAALDFLKHVREVGWEKAKEHADRYWASVAKPFRGNWDVTSGEEPPPVGSAVAEGQAFADEVPQGEIEAWLNPTILIEDGGMFVGTIEQFRDCFFDNATLSTIREWADQEGFTCEVRWS